MLELTDKGVRVSRFRFAVSLLVASCTLIGSSGAAATSSSGGRTAEVRRATTTISRRMFSSAGPSAAPVAENFEVLSHVRFEGSAPDADVTVFDHGAGVGTFAYVGSTSFQCGDARGVSIVDVTDPTRPILVGHATGGRNTTTEDIDVVQVGDLTVLGVGYQLCGESSKSGLGLFDVTDPRHPRKLSTIDQPSSGVHELDLVTRGDGRTLALLAVPFAEANTILSGIDFGGDFRIVDISDPTDPVELTNWGVVDDSDLYLVRRPQPITYPFQGLGALTLHFAHSVRAADDGMTAYVSYWDGGVLRFDISDPSSPLLIGRTRYPIDADGEAHSMTPYDVDGTRYLFQADEDPIADAPALVTSNVTGDTSYQALDESWMVTTLQEMGTISGQTADAGDGCESEDFGAVSGRVALVDLHSFEAEPPPCNIGGMILKAANAGAAAVILNYIGQDDPFVFAPSPRKVKRINSVAEGMPVVVVAAADGLVNKIRLGAGPVAPVVTLSATEPSFGYLRVFKETGAQDGDGDGYLDYPQVGSFSDLPHVTGDASLPSGFAWTIHNPEVSGDRIYASWYSHGIVALDISDPSNPTKVGQFVPSTRLRRRYFGPASAFTWGVAVHGGLIYASDLRSGLWIVRPSGDAAPSASSE